MDTPVTDRAGLLGTVAGPLIVQEYDATCLVPTGHERAGGRFWQYSARWRLGRFMVLKHLTVASPARPIPKSASASGGPAHRRRQIRSAQAGQGDPG